MSSKTSPTGNEKASPPKTPVGINPPPVASEVSVLRRAFENIAIADNSYMEEAQGSPVMDLRAKLLGGETTNIPKVTISSDADESVFVAQNKANEEMATEDGGSANSSKEIVVITLDEDIEFAVSPDKSIDILESIKSCKTVVPEKGKVPTRDELKKMTILEADKSIEILEGLSSGESYVPVQKKKKKNKSPVKNVATNVPKDNNKQDNSQFLPKEALKSSEKHVSKIAVKPSKKNLNKNIQFSGVSASSKPIAQHHSTKGENTVKNYSQTISKDIKARHENIIISCEHNRSGGIKQEDGDDIAAYVPTKMELSLGSEALLQENSKTDGCEKPQPKKEIKIFKSNASIKKESLLPRKGSVTPTSTAAESLTAISTKSTVEKLRAIRKQVEDKPLDSASAESESITSTDNVEIPSEEKLEDLVSQVSAQEIDSVECQHVSKDQPDVAAEQLQQRQIEASAMELSIGQERSSNKCDASPPSLESEAPESFTGAHGADMRSPKIQQNSESNSLQETQPVKSPSSQEISISESATNIILAENQEHPQKLESSKSHEIAYTLYCSEIKAVENMNISEEGPQALQIDKQPMFQKREITRALDGPVISDGCAEGNTHKVESYYVQATVSDESMKLPGPPKIVPDELESQKEEVPASQEISNLDLTTKPSETETTSTLEGSSGIEVSETLGIQRCSTDPEINLVESTTPQGEFNSETTVVDMMDVSVIDKSWVSCSMIEQTPERAVNADNDKNKETSLLEELRGATSPQSLEGGSSEIVTRTLTGITFDKAFQLIEKYWAENESKNDQHSSYMDDYAMEVDKSVVDTSKASNENAELSETDKLTACELKPDGMSVTSPEEELVAKSFEGDSNETVLEARLDNSCENSAENVEETPVKLETQSDKLPTIPEHPDRVNREFILMRADDLTPTFSEEEYDFLYNMPGSSRFSLDSLSEQFDPVYRRRSFSDIQKLLSNEGQKSEEQTTIVDENYQLHKINTKLVKELRDLNEKVKCLAQENSALKNKFTQLKDLFLSLDN